MDKNIECLKGVGKARALEFARIGIHTVNDLLFYFPRTYEDRSVLKNIEDCVKEETVCLSITVSSAVRETRIRRNMAVYTVMISDDTGSMQAVWYNNKYIKNVFSPGNKYIFYGKIGYGRGRLQIENPIYERAGANKYTGKIVPIYPLTGNITQKMLQSIMQSAVDYRGDLEEYLPPELLNALSLADIQYSMKNIHFPEKLDDYRRARERFVFDELLTLQLALFLRKSTSKKNDGIVFHDISGGDTFKKNIPYRLTDAQKRVISDIISDFKSGVCMNRLVQGDVGSGKTIVAAAAVFLAHKNGYQSAMMAPTEILAAQHYQTFSEVFGGMDINVVLLVGSMTVKEKRVAYEKISNGEADVIIGTHAVIEDMVKFNNLGLVIADEQHRFGVAQRARLCAKGENPHMLVMSATPIPRTLALILYGDLDVSIIDELPPGRKPVKTYAVDEKMRKRVYAFVEKNIKEGRQAYIVCPLVEETQTLDLENAKSLYEKLEKMFPDINVAMVHGRMKPSEKDIVMTDFKNGKIDILVSTTVIEVGVNVPNANIMVIENAERFGLSQLHQLRGRVGRGAKQSFCILFSHGNNEITKKRMETMCSSNDGFYISEQDLKLRGPGDFFGLRQHGLPSLKIANLFEDGDILKKAQAAAREISPHLLDDEKFVPLYRRVVRIIEKAQILN